MCDIGNIKILKTCDIARLKILKMCIMTRYKNLKMWKMVLLHSNDLKEENGITYLPLYMTPFL